MVYLLFPGGKRPYGSDYADYQQQYTEAKADGQAD